MFFPANEGWKWLSDRNMIHPSFGKCKDTGTKFIFLGDIIDT
jgi:hypothetical protein